MRNRLPQVVVALPLYMLAPVGVAQNLPTFEVATLKRSPPPTTPSFSIVLGGFQNGRFVFINATLNEMVQYAFDLPSKELLVGLDWSDAVRFDVEAKAPSDTPIPQLRLMAQQLLKERLHLVTRVEQRTVRYAALVVGGTGSKLRPAAAPVPIVQAPGRINHTRMPMGMLASLLSRFEQTLIVDRTGLEGFYEIQLEWAPDPSAARDATTAQADRPSLSAAVQEQLGLRLETRREPLDVVVIQGASRIPEPN